MEIFQFLTTLGIAIALPYGAIAYLRPVLTRVMVDICESSQGGEFWIRSATLLALCGSLVMVIAFSPISQASDWLTVIQRTLLLTLLGIFVSVGFIARTLWRQIARLIDEKALLSGTQPHHP